MNCCIPVMAVVIIMGCVGDMQHWLISAYHYDILGVRFCQQAFLKEKEKEIFHKLSDPNCEGFWNIRDERLWEMVVRDEGMPVV